MTAFTAPFSVDPAGRPRLQTITYTPAPETLTLAPRRGYLFVADTTYHNPDTTYDPVSISRMEHLLPASGLSLDAYPNPFNATVAIRIGGMVDGLAIYDITGRQLADLTLSARNHNELKWNATHLNSGFYIVKARQGKRTIQKKILLIK
jgi:hypothetical protein